MFRKNKFLLGLVLLAAIGFVSLSAGGEFLHSKIHHHKDQSSHDKCPVYQLQTQAFTALSAVVLALFFQFSFRSIKNYRKFVFQSLHNLPHLRAPPISLF